MSLAGYSPWGCQRVGQGLAIKTMFPLLREQKILKNTQRSWSSKGSDTKFPFICNRKRGNAGNKNSEKIEI